MATESSVARPILQRWWPYLDRLRPVFWVDQRVETHSTGLKGLLSVKAETEAWEMNHDDDDNIVRHEWSPLRTTHYEMYVRQS